MKYVVTLLLVLVSTNLLATDATDVSMMNLNGPVKSYRKDGETFYFDKSGNLTHAVRSTKVDLIFKWDEYYIHIFDKKNKRIKTNVFKDSSFKDQLYTIKYKYDKKGVLIESKEVERDVVSSYNVTKPFWKEVLSKYGKKKHKPNSVIKDVHKTDTIYCSYNEKGELTLYKLIEPSLCMETEVSFGEDTITNCHSTNGNTIVIRNSKNQLLERFHRDTTGADTRICIEHYKYNEQGLLEEKSMYRKNYNVIGEIRDIDCVITYKYDSWNNLVGEEWYHKDTKQTIRKNHLIEYY
ncbi:MAG: hypothetical protein IKV67_02780 [Paludibacteraceae bacterium]|nr:hypothetical protein [Paludibacteraceae bacterium]